jgi:hypothetical protein
MTRSILRFALLALALAALVAGAVALGVRAASAEAHAVPAGTERRVPQLARASDYVGFNSLASHIRATNAGGECGEGFWWRCRGSWSIVVWDLGATGSHSRVVQVQWGEQHVSGAAYRTCRQYQRWYHYEKADTWGKYCW